ncbi:hypothetical protein R3W88_032001 [Solanum pinnatisectum]|uniref:Uncharacterized protein n=1 Tax=Solanum pinnatisectum TaxID=50273 RepID=A0AAV9LRD0_9SOLN|nr:hypothetical protein R3W88_032001 [Solanum pinnatisectum]
MAPRLNIERITTDTPDWTCKVQIVDMSQDRLCLESKIRFQNLILEDKQKLMLLDTYLISTARVKLSLPSYGKIIHKFYWVLDKETLIEHIKPRLPPTKLHTTTFVSIPQMTPGPNAEIGNVLYCGPSKYAGHTQNMCREVTIADDQAKTNKDMILGNVSDNLAESSTGLIVNPVHRQVISIVEITSAASVILCARMSGCKPKKCTKDKKQFDCAKCQRKTSLVPRYYIYVIYINLLR